MPIHFRLAYPIMIKYLPDPMTPSTLILEMITFGFSLWLGLYLLSRNFANLALRLTGFGVLAYALALLTNILIAVSGSAAYYFLIAELFFILLPAILWAAALNNLLPPERQISASLLIIWAFLAIPLYLYVVILLASNLIPAPIFVISPILFLPLLIVIYRFVRFSRGAFPDKWKGWLLIVTLFFTLSTGLAVSLFDVIARPWLLLAVGLDLEILAYLIAYYDAFEEGENLKQDMQRSFGIALVTTALFAGQVALAIHFVTGFTFTMVALLLGTISTSIFMVTLSSPLLSVLEHLLLMRSSNLRQDRADLRATTQALSRVNLAIDPQEIGEQDFARYTRRALSHFGDLPRLASNPLTRLSLIEARLQAKSSRLDTLNRAAELKLLLSESIQQLKPKGQGDFGASDEWRFYNSLYFPYVVGLKVYSRGNKAAALDQASEEALDWFQLQVPQRTLHNWQKAAADLVAQDLRERIGVK